MSDLRTEGDPGCLLGLQQGGQGMQAPPVSSQEVRVLCPEPSCKACETLSPPCLSVPVVFSASRWPFYLLPLMLSLSHFVSFSICLSVPFVLSFCFSRGVPPAVSLSLSVLRSLTPSASLCLPVDGSVFLSFCFPYSVPLSISVLPSLSFLPASLP